MTEKLLWTILLSNFLPLLVLFFIQMLWRRQDTLKAEIKKLGQERIQNIEGRCDAMQKQIHEELVRMNKRVDDLLRNRAQ